MSSWFRLKVLRLVKGVSVERCSGGLSCVQGSRCSWDVDSCGFVYLGLNLWDDNYFFPPSLWRQCFPLASGEAMVVRAEWGSVLF